MNEPTGITDLKDGASPSMTKPHTFVNSSCMVIPLSTMGLGILNQFLTVDRSWQLLFWKAIIGQKSDSLTFSMHVSASCRRNLTGSIPMRICFCALESMILGQSQAMGHSIQKQ